ncbi:FxsA family protein [Thetidibacter halocola]|uniref:FxsA family protein n=1 Tax=Thetidibacter halocola TaxID=2827239 RepID=A0A8J8B782_9RHOB|nr:FxsA family protein [Thetidibacter halocola]MBS0123454.1 FxsA family protein [Thetidibacter halocola]
MWLFIAFLTVPLIEIALFIQVGGLIGLWPTLGIVVLTAILGTWLVRAQGRLALGQLRTSFERLDDPSEPLAHGAMILISGALLLTPGFFTDALGFSLLIPAVRMAVFRWLKSRVKVQSFTMGPQDGPGRTERPAREDVIEGTFTEAPDPSASKRPNHPGSGWTRH